MPFQARQGDIDSTSPHAYRELSKGINNTIAIASQCARGGGLNVPLAMTIREYVVLVCLHVVMHR